MNKLFFNTRFLAQTLAKVNWVCKNWFTLMENVQIIFIICFIGCSKTTQDVWWKRMMFQDGEYTAVNYRTKPSMITFYRPNWFENYDRVLSCCIQQNMKCLSLWWTIIYRYMRYASFSSPQKYCLNEKQMELLSTLSLSSYVNTINI